MIMKNTSDVTKENQKETFSMSGTDLYKFNDINIGTKFSVKFFVMPS